MNTLNHHRYISPTVWAKRNHRAPRTILAAIANRELPAIRIGKRWLLDLNALEDIGRGILRLPEDRNRGRARFVDVVIEPAPDPNQRRP